MASGLQSAANSENVIVMDASLSSPGIPVSLDEIPIPVSHPRIFIDRDYTTTLGARFSTELPPDLLPFIDANTFKNTIEEINTIYMDAEKCGARSFFETITTVLSFNLISLCRKTYYEKCLAKVAKLISAKNRNVFKRRGLRMVDPIYHGLRKIEIIIIDHEFRT